MGRNINSGKLTKQYVLSKVSQITIFSTYLGISDSIIQHCIETGELIRSPLRIDAHPTCGFRYDKKGKLKFRDFAGYFWGDCFDLVAYVISNITDKKIDVSDKKDFIGVLTHITRVFKDIFYGKERDVNLINEINTSIDSIKNKKNIIELVTRDWNNDDIKYWKQFGIGLKDLNINFVYPVDQFYVNRKINPKPKYYYDVKDPCYGYLLGRDRNGISNIKLYFPKRDKGYTKFMCNCNHLEGIYQLERNDYDCIIITKSTKDRIAIGCAVKRYISLYGGINVGNIGVINIPHETYHLRHNEYDWLTSKLSKQGVILSLMDNDRTGKLEALWLRKTYGIKPILINHKYNAKDFSELVANNDKDTVDRLITQTLMYLENVKVQYLKYEEENNTLPYWN